MELLDLARASGAARLFVVGTGRDVGKTTTLRAIYAAARERGMSIGLGSVGRDGDGAVRDGARRKPSLRLLPGTFFVTARGALPRTPAVEILGLTQLQSAAGALLYARVAASAMYELAGPPTASGVREIVARLSSWSEFVLVDGAVDRIAALAGLDGAIVAACGASTSNTMQEAVDEIAALVARLRVAAFDPHAPALHVEGALTAARAAALLAAGESRQIVVRDPTQIALNGKAASQVLARLRVRCERPLHVVATTIASIGTRRSFEPRAFAHAVADATGLPAFDVYAGARAA